jgi:hypothetical protein
MSIRKMVGTLGMTGVILASMAVASAPAEASTPYCNGYELCYYYNSNYGGGVIGFLDKDHGGGECIPNYAGYYFTDGHPVVNEQASAWNRSEAHTAFMFINHIASDCSGYLNQPRDPLGISEGYGMAELPAAYKNNLRAHSWY